MLARTSAYSLFWIHTAIFSISWGHHYNQCLCICKVRQNLQSYVAGYQICLICSKCFLTDPSWITQWVAVDPSQVTSESWDLFLGDCSTAVSWKVDLSNPHHPPLSPVLCLLSRWIHYFVKVHTRVPLHKQGKRVRLRILCHEAQITWKLLSARIIQNTEILFMWGMLRVVIR